MSGTFLQIFSSVSAFIIFLFLLETLYVTAQVREVNLHLMQHTVKQIFYDAYYIKTEIKIGIRNNGYVEVISGLNQGDIIVAEPKALIGVAGTRVIEQTVRQKLPEGFQRSEFLLEHGAIDMIVDRRQMREKLSSLILHFQKKSKLNHSYE